MKSGAAAALLVAAGCAAGQAAPPAVSGPERNPASRSDAGTATPERTAPLRRGALQFELAGQPFPMPVVHGTIAGRPTWMLVDTGATSHAVTGWFARAHGLPLETIAGASTDHAGRSVRMFRTEGSVVSLDGWGSLGAGPRLVFEMPEIIEKLGVGMFVSPQLLAEEGSAVVLDLERGELRLDTRAAARAALGGRGDALPAARTCVESGAIRGLSFVIPATIEGRAAELLVDTGAQHTDVFETSAAGTALSSRAGDARDKVVGASGRIHTRTLKGAKVHAGDHDATLDVALIPGKSDVSCARDGVLGMDALRRCVLVFAADEVEGRCAR